MTHLDRTISSNVSVLFGTFRGIRDGHREAIHDARVATRRLNAALPLAWAGSAKSSWREAATAVGQLGKALGRVRDLDVALERLPELEARVPAAVATIAEFRVHLARQQWVERRRLIKEMERLPLDRGRALDLIPARRLSLRADRRWLAIEQAMVEHADRVRDAIAAASGVYFPNRAHRLRIEMKKLRYVLELAPHAPGAMSAVKRLKRSQELLGQMHDHQRLSEVLGTAKAGDKVVRRDLIASVDAATADFFRQYLERRPQLLDVCRQVAAAATHGDWRPRALGATLLKAGAVLAPSAVMLLTRENRRPAAPARHDRGDAGRTRDETAVDPVRVPASVR